MSATKRLIERLDVDTLARLGAALWFSIDKLFTPQDFVWSQTILGTTDEQLVWAVLQENQVLTATSRIDPAALARCLGNLSEKLIARDGGSSYSQQHPLLVWTIPDGWSVRPPACQSYAKAIRDTINIARDKIYITAPFIEQAGIEMMLDPLLSALGREVSITIITHDLTTLSSPQSVALERLRKEASRLRKALIAYSVASDSGGLLHAKIVVADKRQMVVGSANLTYPGLVSNCEVGVILGENESDEMQLVLSRLIRCGPLKMVFSTV